jgi:hypothetical protein
MKENQTMNETIAAQLMRMDPGRLKGYKELLDFYYGKQWEGKGRWHERRLTFNYAKVFIEKITSYLMGGINFTVDPNDNSDKAAEQARKAEAVLRKVYSENCLEQLDLETEIDCAVLGDGCYKVIWDATEKRVRVTAPDVQGIYAWWSGDDTSRLWRLASRYQLTQEEIELLYDVKSKNKTAVVVEIWTDRDFELYLDNALLESKPNPYGFIPFVVFPNLREPKKFWGVSDLVQITESQRELNRAMSQLSRILELSGNPIAVLENVEESEDIAVFIADASVLYVLKYVNGSWQAKTAWDKTTGDLSGVACVYDGDWNLLVTGKDTSGNYKMWSLVYGDGGDVTAGTWSALKELASAPSGGDYLYKQPFLDKTDVFRGVFVEKYSGIESYSRPFQTHTLPGTHYYDGLWCEAAPFNQSCESGLAITHHGDYGWLTNPDSVWRLSLTSQTLDITSDIISVRQEIEPTGGTLTVELKNDDGKYASPGAGDITVLDRGCQLDFSPGYRTTVGNEYSAGQSYCLEIIEHVSAGGKASVILRARDGWGALSDWDARHQMRWNKSTSEKNAKDIITYLVARAGLNLGVKSQSTTITDFYPDFTVSPNDDGKNVIEKLLSFVLDFIFIEGNNAYLVNPQSSDSSGYSYGSDHVIIEGKYRQGALAKNRIQVEGYDTSQGKILVVESHDWDEIDRLDDRAQHVQDRNLTTTTKGYQRGDAYLRKANIAATGGAILVPVNCGQQLYDVIDVTDANAGLTATKKRVLGITLVYRPQRGEYLQRLELGGV